MTVRVSSYSGTRIRECVYSVPSRLIGAFVQAHVSEETVRFVYRGKTACYPRSVGQAPRIDYRHVIASLVGKPGEPVVGLPFDEIEKAHPRILDVLLQLLDAARLTTSRNRVLDFSEWYVVLTSNIGAQRIMTLRKSKYETMDRLVRQDAQRELRPEIFARITVTVVFNRLDYEAQCEIADGMIAKECSALSERGLEIRPDRSVSDVVIQRGYHERLGARPMRDAAELLIRNAVARELLTSGNGTGRLRSEDGGMTLKLKV